MLLAITLHEVAHGWTARYFGDRTAELLGRLSLNPLRHIDPVGTVLVPCVLLAMGGLMFGWAKPVPVATQALRNPRLATLLVALAGPGANLLMLAGWGAILALTMHMRTNQTVDGWMSEMAQAGMFTNVLLAVFNLLPIPPLDGGRALAALLPFRWVARIEKVEPVGLFIVLGLSVLGMLDWLFHPAVRGVSQAINVLMSSRV